MQDIGRRLTDNNQVLLKRGTFSVNEPADEGATPLHLAAHFGLAVMTNILLAAGADVNARDSLEQTPLHLAAAQRYPSTIRSLIRAGASTEARDCDDSIPLYSALMHRGDDAVIRELISPGVIPAFTDLAHLEDDDDLLQEPGMKQLRDTKLKFKADEAFRRLDGASLETPD